MRSNQNEEEKCQNIFASGHVKEGLGFAFSHPVLPWSPAVAWMISMTLTKPKTLPLSSSTTGRWRYLFWCICWGQKHKRLRRVDEKKRNIGSRDYNSGGKVFRLYARAENETKRKAEVQVLALTHPRSKRNDKNKENARVNRRDNSA